MDDQNQLRAEMFLKSRVLVDFFPTLALGWPCSYMTMPIKGKPWEGWMKRREWKTLTRNPRESETKNRSDEEKMREEIVASKIFKFIKNYNNLKYVKETEIKRIYVMWGYVWKGKPGEERNKVGNNLLVCRSIRLSRSTSFEKCTPHILEPKSTVPQWIEYQNVHNQGDNTACYQFRNFGLPRGKILHSIWDRCTWEDEKQRLIWYSS